MARVSDARMVVLDTTVIRHYHDAGQVLALAQYLKGNGCAADDVHREIGFQARSRPQLQFIVKAGWPKKLGGLPKPVIDRGFEIQQDWLEDGDRPDAHLGEIFTVLAASHFGADVIVTDDRRGLALASIEGVPGTRAGNLIAEMVKHGIFDDQTGWSIYRLTRKKPKREGYDAAKAAAE
jgi:hypothetical protein